MSLFSDLPDYVTIERQIECVERELRLRERVYPRRVSEKKMSQALADTEIRCMQAVLCSLRSAKAAADAVKAKA